MFFSTTSHRISKAGLIFFHNLRMINFVKSTLNKQSRILRRCVSLTFFSYLLIVLCGCQTNCRTLEPQIDFVPPVELVENLPSAFPPLTPDEQKKVWGKELLIANNFAIEMDFYRAITSYKRALFLIPPAQKERYMQIEYGILQSYYLGRKYQSVIDVFEKSTLIAMPEDFPAFDDLLIMLEDSYRRVGELEKACKILKVIESRTPSVANNLELSESFLEGRLGAIQEKADADEGISPVLCGFLCGYHQQALSVRKAQTLNALLPGAGYLYVGQKSTALTSFIINALFIAAAYYFFDQGNIAAGIITTSLESGWYFGGINGAGLAAKVYNEQLYNASAKELMIQQHLFPVLMLKYTF